MMPKPDSNASVRPGERPVLITGGAGFVATNVADRLLRAGRRVIVFDNLSRPGVEQNLNWLRGRTVPSCPFNSATFATPKVWRGRCVKPARCITLPRRWR